MNSNSNFSTNCTSASSSPSSSPVSFRSASPKAPQQPPANQPPAPTAAQQLAAKSGTLSSQVATSHQPVPPHHHALLSNAHLAQQALKHQVTVQSLMSNHSANHHAHHQLAASNASNQAVQAQSMLANMVGNGAAAADLTGGFNPTQFNQFFPTLHHHQFWQNLNDPFYRPFVS